MYAAYNECPNNGVDFEEFYITFNAEDKARYEAFLSTSQESRWEKVLQTFFVYFDTASWPGKRVSVEVLLGYSEETGLREEGRRSRPRDWQDERD